MASASDSEKKVLTVRCAICTEIIPTGEDTGLKCTSSHVYCTDCSATCACSVLTDEVTHLMSRTQIPCPLCKAPIVLETFERQLTAEQLPQFLSWRAVQEMSGESGVLRSCTHCSYFAIVDPDLQTFYCENEARRVACKSEARPHVVWIRNLPKAATEAQVRALAGPTATCADVGVPKGSATASAWVTFASAAHAAAAVGALHGRAQAGGGSPLRAVLSGSEAPAEKEVVCRRAHCGVCLRDVRRMSASDERLPPAEYERLLFEPGFGPATHFECHPLGPFKALVDKAIHESTGQLCPWGCGLLATKDDACSHITCTKCERQWCYFCARKIDDCAGTTPAAAEGRYGTHNVGWEHGNRTRCPQWYYIIRADADDHAWPEGDRAANEHFNRIVALRRMKALLPVLGAAAIAAAAARGGAHPFVAAAVAGGATPAVAGARLYEALHGRFNFGYTRAEIEAFDASRPLIAPGRRVPAA